MRIGFSCQYITFYLNYPTKIFIISFISGRQAKEMSQKDLATKICEKPQVVTEYEQGKAIPNQAVLAKMERVLGMKLRGKDKGQPLEPKGKKK